MADGGAFQGSLADAITKISIEQKGEALAAVLKAVQPEIDSVGVTISNDMRRAAVELRNGYRVAIRVTVPRFARPGARAKLRFKPPVNLHRFEKLIFGGLTASGRPVVYRFKPEEIRGKRTLTLDCSDP